MLEHAPVSEAERIRRLVGDALGLRIDDDDLVSLRELVRSRMRAVGRVDLEQYAEILATSTGEAGELARHLCVNETYVLRDIAQFDALARWLRRRPRGAGPLRMLSAGCSSGEEAFSLALVASRTLPGRDSSRARILGVDLDPEAIHAARAGRFSAWSLREVPRDVRQAWFTETKEGFRLGKAVREMVELRQENLVGPMTETWRPRSWDVVFCRNVLMYLTREAASMLVARISSALVDGGLLLLGHAETLRGLSSDFEIRQEPGAFLHVRRRRSGSTADRAIAPVEDVACTSSEDDGWFRAIGRSTSRIEGLTRASRSERAEASGASDPEPPAASDLERVMRLIEEDRPGEALLALGNRSGDRDGEVKLLRAVLLANGGRIAEAERECDAMLARLDLDARAHYVKALCREQCNDLEGALEHDQLAAYLDPTFAMPQLHAGLLLRRLGRSEPARAALRTALRLLPREEPRRIALFGGGFGREALVAVCESELLARGGPV